MPIALANAVNAYSGSGTNTITTGSVSTSAGDMAVVNVGHDQSTAFTSITDNQTGNDYTTNVSHSEINIFGTSHGREVYDPNLTNGSATHTWTLTTGTNGPIHIGVFHITGHNTSDALDATSNASGFGTSIDSGAATVIDGKLMTGALQSGTSQTFTLGGTGDGWTEAVAPVGSDRIYLAYRSISSGSDSFGGTVGSNVDWLAFVSIWNEAAGGTTKRYSLTTLGVG